MTDQINDPTKPGYSWIEVNHHVKPGATGIAALVDVRCLFVGKDGKVVNTPGVGFRLADAEALAAEILAHAHAAYLEASAAGGDPEAIAALEEEAQGYDDEHNSRN
jgi:hypothetical protein